MLAANLNRYSVAVKPSCQDWAGQDQGKTSSNMADMIHASAHKWQPI